MRSSDATDDANTTGWESYYLDIGNYDVRALLGPREYKQAILEKINQSKGLIVLSALYIGTGDHEKSILDRIEAALADPSRPDLRVIFILDHSRAHRYHSTISKVNSMTFLSNINKRFHPRIKVFLYQMPSIQNSYLLKLLLSYQLREVLGVYHCKYCLFDDDVIITGANLSTEYFEARQDRYYLISSCTKSGRQQQSHSRGGYSSTHDGTLTSLQPMNLNSYLNLFTDIVSRYCYELIPAPSGGGYLLKEPIHRSSGDSAINPDNSVGSIQSLAGAYDISTGDDEHGNVFSRWLPHSNQASSQHKHRKHQQSTTTTAATNSSTIILPIIQHNQLHINQEIDTLTQLLHRYSITCARSLLSIMTPYSNFRPSFLALLLQPLMRDRSVVTITTPSVRSHGFSTATGWKKYIPSLHYYALMHDSEAVLSQLLSNTSSYFFFIYS